MGKKREKDLPAGSRNLNMVSYSNPSEVRTTGLCGFINIGSLRRMPVTSSTKRFAGFFCLNMPITDNGRYAGSLVIFYFGKTNIIPV